MAASRVQIVIDLFTNGPTIQHPPTLYHYCSEDTFRAILTSRVVRLSSHQWTNDSAEDRWIDDLVDNHAQMQTSQSARELVGAIREAFHLNKQELFLACFSQQGDLLSQWRSYADDGAGLSIGVRPDYFGFSRHLSCMGETYDLTLGLSPVMYERQQQQYHAAQLIEQAIASVTGGKDRGTAVADTAFRLRQISTIAKNDAFSEEQEWRIIYSPIQLVDRLGNGKILGPLTQIQSRPTAWCAECFVSFFDLPIAREGGDGAISEVITGPRCPLTRDDVVGLCNAAGFSDVKVYKSRATYRRLGR